MDQVVEVTGHPSSKGVHYEVHLFLHHLHLHDYMRGSHICVGWTAGILLFLSIGGAGSFLVFLLGVKCYVLLAQLFL